MGMLLVVILVFSSHSQTIFPSVAKNALGTRLSVPVVMLVLGGKQKLGQWKVVTVITYSLGTRSFYIMDISWAHAYI